MLLHYQEFSNNVEKNKYKMTDLRDLIKDYKIKVKCRKKTDAIEHIYLFLRHSFFAIHIQKVYRGFLHRRLLKLKGEGWKNIDKCVNETDFYTLDTLNEIPAYEFFSFKDGEQLYGASIVSLFKLLLQTNGKHSFSNPYNRNTVKRTELANAINSYIRISTILKIPIEFHPEEKEMIIQEQTQQQEINQRINNVFIEMDQLGNYTQASWFLNIETSAQILYFVNQLYDIWNYRAQLSIQTKNRISNGLDIFRNINLPQLKRIINSNGYTNARNPTVEKNNYMVVRKAALTVMERLVYSADNVEDRSLGSIYVLTALTLVSREAAEALPWLYSSVAHL